MNQNRISHIAAMVGNSRFSYLNVIVSFCSNAPASPTRAAAKNHVFEYIEIYCNRKQLHSVLGYQTQRYLKSNSSLSNVSDSPGQDHSIGKSSLCSLVLISSSCNIHWKLSSTGQRAMPNKKFISNSLDFGGSISFLIW